MEPLIAVCADEDEARRIEADSSARGRHVSWEEHPLQGTDREVGPLEVGRIVHVVLLGGSDIVDGPDDPIGIAVYADGEAAERRAAEELRTTGSPGYRAIALPVGWRAPGPGRSG
ncbi:hypothetical protein [Pseudonocardia sp. HH130630-07]|uniref:hypothetical protein n=1 Tax=Pseudonocardia sp. HH130630-07 TaxID=1690815 RepID=UPI00081501C2|nr:hypothetical protein [Pseudonocardia sp. HH130630-07]ANY08257.1 hypothetical protein AFB00_20455 [Pseudonocardia sp. HH130630-07]